MALPQRSSVECVVGAHVVVWQICVGLMQNNNSSVRLYASQRRKLLQSVKQQSVKQQSVKQQSVKQQSEKQQSVKQQSVKQQSEKQPSVKQRNEKQQAVQLRQQDMKSVSRRLRCVSKPAFAGFSSYVATTGATPPPFASKPWLEGSSGEGRSWR